MTNNNKPLAVPNSMRNFSKEFPYIGSAVDIFDETLEKPQSQVNQERIADIAAETQRAQAEENFLQGEINALDSQNYVTVATYAGLPDTGAADTIYRVSSWDGTQVDATKYAEYAWKVTGEDTGEYVLLDVKTQVGEVFDISLYKAVGGVLATFADLSAALDGGNNVPAGVRQGGMSIKFVQSSDNKYVHYNLLADSFTTDTTQWAIAEEGVYVENPEFVYVKTDKDDKILWAIKTDGGIYYGAGVPQQVIDYIEEKIAELSLDEYEDIVVFLANLEKGDKTLQTLLNEKVDKVEGKSLIDAEYASTKSSIDNPEFLEVTLDTEDKVLEGIQKDGTKVIGGDLNVGGSASINGDTKILGNMEVSGVSYKVIENPEYLAAWVDAEDKVIFGLKADGKTYVGDANFPNDIENIKDFLQNITDKNIDWDALSSITAVENPEFIEAKTDSEGKLLAGRTNDGAAFENVGFSTPKVSIADSIVENIEDIEERIEIQTDSNGKILSYRKPDGTKVEKCSTELNGLVLTDKGMSDLQTALINAGFKPNNYGDWSDDEFVHIPMPQFALVNIKCEKQKEAITAKSGLGTPGVDCEIPATLEFWDMQGNYFCKPVEISAQGSSSMMYYVKNLAIDITDGSTIKFGNLVEQDSFHLKKYYQDIYRGQCVVAYHLMEQVYKTRPVGKMKPWDYLNISDSANGSGNFIADFNEAALAHPDGFPFTMFWNGAYSGLYCFNLKKHRANYNMGKNEYKKIILDGEIGSDTMWDGVIDWTAFEIRNPKDLYYAPYEQLSAETQAQIDNGHISKSKTVDGVKYYKYDGDFPDLLTDNASVDKGVSAFVRGSIERLATSKALIEEASAEDKPGIFESFFNKDFMVDYFVTSQVLYHWDGFRKNWIWCIWDADYDSVNDKYTGHWVPTLYDCDSIWGITFDGTEFLNTDGQGLLTLGSSDRGTGRNPATLCYELFRTDVQTRYNELKNKDVFTATNLMALMNSWIDRIGYENLKKERDYMTSLGCDIPSYRDGNAQYPKIPQTGGVYNSLKRICEWINIRLNWLNNNL